MLFLSGGSGFVGSRLIEIYAPDLPIKALEHKTPLLSKSVTTISGDLLDLDALVQATRGCTSILHIGGASPNRAYRDGHFDATLNGTKNLIQAAQINGIARFIFISSSCATHASGPYGRSKLSAEKDVMNSGLSWTIFRPTTIVGTGGKDFSRMLQFWSKAKLIPVIGEGEYFKQPVFVDDLCKVIVKSVKNPDAFSRIIPVAGPDTLPFNLFVTAFANALGNQGFRLLHLPLAFVKPVAVIAMRLNPKWGLNSERVDIITHSNTFEITDFRKLLCAELTGFEKMTQLTVESWAKERKTGNFSH